MEMLTTSEAAEIGARIKDLRTEQGHTLRGLAERLGVSHAYLYKVEAGLRWPNVERLVQLAKALNTTPNDLLGF